MVAAAVVLFAILDPDVMERGRALLFSLSQDDSASATAPFSSRIITATPRPSLTARPTRTPRPAVTPRPGAKPPDTRYVIVAGEINARACPRRNCTVLRTLEPGSGVTVVEEVRGERVNAASERWALVVLPDLSRRAYVYSAFLGPEPAVPPEASATPPPTTTPRPGHHANLHAHSPCGYAATRRQATRYALRHRRRRDQRRACPRRNCTVLRTLEPGSGVTVVEEVRGERVTPPVSAGPWWCCRICHAGPTSTVRFLVPSRRSRLRRRHPSPYNHAPTNHHADTSSNDYTQPDRHAIPSPTPHLRFANSDGVRVRTCPRKDERDCGILARLGNQVTVLGETRGEQHEGSPLWYRIALPNGTGDAFVHSSCWGRPRLCRPTDDPELHAPGT